MKDIVIGQNADGVEIKLTAKMRQMTHMHVIGGSGKGKSKFLEWLIRHDIKAGHGLCLVDWHGTLYKDVLRYCALLDVGLFDDYRKIILVNPSRPDFVTGFNPFMNQGADVATQVSRRIDATIRPWGITDTNEMPTFERLCRLVYTFAVELEETLPNVAQLLSFDNKNLRAYASKVISDPYIKQQWQQLEHMKTFRDWSQFALSTENRLSRFLTSKTIKRFMGLKEGNINLLEAMNEGHIVLVNLGSSQFLDRESARVFASLLLNEFFETAMLRAQAAPRGEKPATFSLYLDEFQEYITDDIAAMLDQVRKRGLHMILAHQHLAHLAKNEHLLASILVNARIRAVFGGLTYEEAALLSNEMFLPDLNTRQIKKAYYHTIHLFEEQTRVIRSSSVSQGWTSGSGSSVGKNTGEGGGSSQGIGAGSGFSTSMPMINGIVDPMQGVYNQGQNQSNFSGSNSSRFEGESESSSSFDSESFASSETESIVPVFVPIPKQELTTEAEWTREEKVSRTAELLKIQPQQHCIIKFDTETAESLEVPFVKDPPITDYHLQEYEHSVFQTQGAVSGEEADRVVSQSQMEFLQLVEGTLGDEITIDTVLPKQNAEKVVNPAKTAKIKKGTIYDMLKKDNPDLDI